MALDLALVSWSDAIGAEHVLSDPAARTSAETATFATTQRVPAVIRPGSTAEVQACVRIANEHRVPVYPVSGGRNWGLGSRVPVRDGCVVMDLSRMDRIVAFDDRLATITVEPGITFMKASEFVRANSRTLYVPAIGGPPESSLIGNALERGDGVGPCGERVAHACGFEVVLPDGECIHTGFERFGDGPVARLTRFGVGPSLDGLFSQSSLGIVTRMTFWLPSRPACFQPFLFTMRDSEAMREAVERLRPLQAAGVLRSNSVAIWNSYKMVACDLQYPWDMTGGRTPLRPDEVRRMNSPWARTDWIGIGGLYSASRAHGAADRRMVKAALRDVSEKMLFLDATKVRLALRFRGLVGRLTGLDVEEAMRTSYTESVFLGWPTRRSTRSTYWRKRTPIPADMNPDRDRCGVVWCCPVVPFDGDHVVRATGLVTEIAFKHWFEPHIAFVAPSERAVYMFPAIVYDRDAPGEDDRAMACHDEMLAAMVREGYLPYRLGIQSMGALPPSEAAYTTFMSKLRELIDQNGIVAPGRYQVEPG